MSRLLLVLLLVLVLLVLLVLLVQLVVVVVVVGESAVTATGGVCQSYQTKQPAS